MFPLYYNGIKLCRSSCNGRISNKSIATDIASKVRSLPTSNNSFVLNIFRGSISEKRIFPYPEILTSGRKKNLKTLISPTEKFLAEINDAAKNELEGHIDKAVLSELWNLGLFGPLISKEQGGLGLNNTQYARLLETIGAYDLSIGVVLKSHQINGLNGIMAFGTEEQKAEYLPRAAQGEIAGYCLREKSAGSDYHSMTTRAILSEDQSHYILNGSKIFITNGRMCDIMTVFAQTAVLDQDGDYVDKLTAFIVERSFGNIETGESPTLMGMRAVNIAQLSFEDVKVPVENVLGKVGQGHQVVLHTLDSDRYAVPALLSGCMRSLIQAASEYTRTHIQFKKTMRSFELTQKELARMAMLQYVTETMVYVISAQIDNELEECFVEAAISKYFSTEAAWAVGDECLQLMGGVGYMTKTGIEKVVRDVRMFRIVEVSNEVLYMVIALAGITFAQMHRKELMERTVKRIGLGSPSIEPYVHDSLREPARMASKCIDNFGKAVDKVLDKYGDGIVTRQMILSKLADCTVDIFAMAVVLSRATNALRRNSLTAEYERVVAQCWCVEAYSRINTALNILGSKPQQDNLKRYVMISDMLNDARGIVQTSPVNV